MTDLDEAPAFLGEERGGPVHHPTHYNLHPSGVECVAVLELLPGNLSNAVKYAWRSDHKGSTLQDLKKCAWYLQRELDRVAGAEAPAAWPWSRGAYRLVERVVDSEHPASLMWVVMNSLNEAMEHQRHERERPQDLARYANYVQLALSFVNKKIEAG